MNLFKSNALAVGLSHFILFGALFVESYAQNYPAVKLANSELRTIESENTERSYDIYILRPSSYGDESKTYPVLYVLDGQWDFKLFDSICGGLVYDGFIPEIIVVGITYSGEDADYNSLRAMDYTTTASPDLEGSGDAAKFLAFLKDELIPKIESEFRTEPDRRLLCGSSFGGLFTLYALFNDPQLFYAYLSASPAVTYVNRHMFALEAQFAEQHTELPARLFMAVGDKEGLAKPVQQFGKIVKGRKYKGLIFESMVVKGEGHASNKPEAFNRGLRFLLQDK